MHGAGGLHGRAGAGRPAGPPRRDHRAGRPQDDDQRAELRARGCSWRTSRTPTRRPGRTCSDGQRNVHDAVRRTIELDTGEKQYRLNDETATLVIRPRGWHLVERHHEVDGAPVSGSLFDFGLVVFYERARAARARDGPVLLPPEARVAPRGAALGAGVRARRGGARTAARLDQVHRADRDDPRRLRDGRDPLRAARPLLRAQRGPLGLHLQLHQEDGCGAARPRAGDDDGAVHARLHAAARPDVPRAGRARDRRHGGVHPLAARPGGERRRAGEGGARTSGARPATASTGPGSRTPTSSPSRGAEFDAVLGERPNQVDRIRGRRRA